jgi:hypothetical protein
MITFAEVNETGLAKAVKIKKDYHQIQQANQQSSQKSYIPSMASYGLRRLYDCTYKERMRDISTNQNGEQGICDGEMYFVNSLNQITNTMIRNEMKKAISAANTDFDTQEGRLNFDVMYEDIVK